MAAITSTSHRAAVGNPRAAECMVNPKITDESKATRPAKVMEVSSLSPSQNASSSLRNARST